MSQLPIGLRPAMGYALWHLLRGEDADTVVSRLERDARYAGYTADERAAIVREAALNAVGSRIAQSSPRTQPIGAAFIGVSPEGIPVALPADTVIGVRVQFDAQVAHGPDRHPSVVVNAAAGASINTIFEAARHYIESGAQSADTGHASPGITLSNPRIIATVIGGYSNATTGAL